MLNLIIMKKILQLLLIIAVLTACQNSSKVDSKQTDSLGGEITKQESESNKSQSDKSELKEIAKINLTEFLDNSKISVEEIEISKDTVINDYIKSLIDSDSVQILEYSKIRYEEMPEIIDERCVYIDYRLNTELKSRISKFPNLLKEVVRKGEIYNSEIPSDGNIVKNNFIETYNLYFTVKSLNGQIILFQYDTYYPVFVNDSSMIVRNMDGWYVNKFNRAEKAEEKLNLSIYGYRNDIFKYTIEVIEPNFNIQVWKPSDYNSLLKIPLNVALEIPVLHILNTGELDDLYENFDKLNLDEMYNN